MWDLFREEREERLEERGECKGEVQIKIYIEANFVLFVDYFI